MCPVNYNSVDGFDTRLLAALIIELNISRRNFKSYPAGHPVVTSGFEKVISHYERLFESRQEIAIGVAKDVLLFGSETLDKSNLVFRDFARTLYEHGISILTLRRGLTIEELRNFNSILGLKRDELHRQGGIEALWQQGHIISMGIMSIRYDLLGSFNAADAAEDVAGSLWERFTRCLMSGADVAGLEADAEGIDPENLAALINGRAGTALDVAGLFEGIKSIADFMNQAAARQSPDAMENVSYDKLAVFVGRLQPDLRRQFLSSAFEINTPDDRSVAEGILDKMPDDIVLESLQDLERHQVKVPPVITTLLQKLSALSAENTSRDQRDDADIKEHIHTIFREHAQEEFVPGEYRNKLDFMMFEKQMPEMDRSGVKYLLATLESYQVESRISDIIMNLIMTGGGSIEDREFFLQNLMDMFGYFLQTGDYGQLLKMIRQAADSSFPIDIQYYLRENYSQREFLDEILNGLTIWGKPRYRDIHQLVVSIGSPFIEVLLDHLATEENMSLRRFMMDRLIDMGPITKVPIANRLYDDRWYVLRNLLTILRAMNDVTIIPLVRPLLHHTNNRVRHEALTTLVPLHDLMAEKQVLRDLDNPDHEIQMNAIVLAEKSRLPDINKKLLALLSKSGLSPSEYELKSAVVKTLGELQRSESLAEFAKILGSSSLFQNKMLARLKIDIIRALENFPFHSVSTLLERLCTGKDDVSKQARESMLKCKGHNQ